jgi:hypothetical protein
MDTQTPIDYYQLFCTLVDRWAELTQKRDQIDVEVSKVRQLIVATFSLLPQEKQRVFQAEIDAIDEPAGLMDAIKLVFAGHKGEWLTVSNVRDYLLEMGFDFGHYRANPLASIGTTLKRMAATQLETTTSGSGSVYRRRKTLGDRVAEYGRTIPPPPGADDLPVSNSSHPIHSAGPIVKVAGTEGFKPKLGYHKLDKQIRDGKK